MANNIQAFRTGYYYAVQVDEKRGLGWQTAIYLKCCDLKDAQVEAKKYSRRRKWGFRVVRVDWVETVIAPLKRVNERVEA